MSIKSKATGALAIMKAAEFIFNEAASDNKNTFRFVRFIRHKEAWYGNEAVYI